MFLNGTLAERPPIELHHVLSKTIDNAEQLTRDWYSDRRYLRAYLQTPPISIDGFPTAVPSFQARDHPPLLRP